MVAGKRRKGFNSHLGVIFITRKWGATNPTNKDAAGAKNHRIWIIYKSEITTDGCFYNEGFISSFKLRQPWSSLCIIKMFCGPPIPVIFFCFNSINYIFLSLNLTPKKFNDPNKRQRRKTKSRWNSDSASVLNWCKKQNKNRKKRQIQFCHTDADVVDTSQLRLEAAPTQSSCGAVISESQIRTQTPRIHRLVSNGQNKRSPRSSPFPRCCFQNRRGFTAKVPQEELDK